VFRRYVTVNDSLSGEGILVSVAVEPLEINEY